jgi:SAM-dependent methyltransferase
MPPLMRQLEIVGSDVDHFECPRCGAHDRERHLLLYMRASGLLDHLRSMRVLHFAPERHLARVIQSAMPSRYVRCDLSPKSLDLLGVDIQAMPFIDASFDLVIANHVLEHVTDDFSALREIARVLAPGGLAILQTPYSEILTRTWSDSGISTESARNHAFGQEDHVRLYGRDIFQRFASTGFDLEIQTHQELLPDIDPEVFGVNPNEPFFRLRRV